MEAKDLRHSGFENLMLITQGHVAFQCLKAGLDLNLFELLEQQGPMTHQEIMEKLKISETPCKILLRSLYSLDLLEKKDERFQNSTTAKNYLTSKSAYSFRDILGWQDKIVYPGITEFTKAIKENKNVGLKHFDGQGNNLYERLSQNKELEKVFQKAMSALSSAANSEFLSQLHLEGIRTIVDVGGGVGTNLKALLEKNLNINGIVFDLPSVCQMADKNIENWGLQNRLSTYSGNLFKDEFPKNVEAFLFCHMFTIWSGEKITQILKKCYNSLPEGGKVIVFNMMSNDDEYGPVSCALGSPYFLTIATGEGKLHTLSEYKDWFNNAGFHEVEFFRGLPIDHSFIIATK